MKKKVVVPVVFGTRKCGDHYHLSHVKEVREPVEMYEADETGSSSSVGYSPTYSEGWDRIFSNKKSAQPN